MSRVLSDGPDQESATLLLGRCEGLEFRVHAGTGLKPVVELMSDPPRRRRATLGELVPAEHPFGAVLGTQSAGDGKLVVVVE